MLVLVLDAVHPFILVLEVRTHFTPWLYYLVFGVCHVFVNVDVVSTRFSIQKNYNNSVLGVISAIHS